MSESLDSDGVLDIPFHGQSLEPLFREIAEYQDLLTAGRLSPEDRDAFTQSLDERWPYMNQRLKVSGNIWLPEYTSDNQDTPDMKMYYVEDVEMESMGFSYLVIGQNEETQGEVTIGHYFMLDAEQISKRPMEALFKSKHAFARPGDVIINYPFIDESEDAARLSYFFEEIIADIDNAFIKSDDECEVVKALGRIEFEIRSDDTYDELSLITKYINSRLTFDHKVPYLMDFEGFCYIADAEGNISNNAMASGGTTMAYPLAIETTSNFVRNEDDQNIVNTEVSIGLRIELLGNLKELDSGKQLIIPIDDTFNMRSIRPYVRALIHSMDSE